MEPLNPVEEPPFPDRIEVDGTVLPLRVERKRVKHLTARLAEGTLRVSAPLRAPRAWIDGNLPVLARRLLRRGRRKDLNRDGAALALARRVAARFPDPPRVDRVEWVPGRPSRWGTWHPAARTMKLSAALLHMPARVLEGVVAHELCHARWRTHGPRFQALLRRVDPHADWVEGFLRGAEWHAREGGSVPGTDRGPLGGRVGAGEGEAAADAPRRAPRRPPPPPPPPPGGRGGGGGKKKKKTKNKKKRAGAAVRRVT